MLKRKVHDIKKRVLSGMKMSDKINLHPQIVTFHLIFSKSESNFLEFVGQKNKFHSKSEDFQSENFELTLTLFALMTFLSIHTMSLLTFINTSVQEYDPQINYPFFSNFSQLQLKRIFWVQMDYIHRQPRTTNHRTMYAGSVQIESRKQLQYCSPILPQSL